MKNLNALAAKLYAGVVYDALRFDLNLKRPFVLDFELKPSWNFDEVLFGPVFTCKGEKVSDPAHIDDSVRIRMFKDFFPGCVQIISSGGMREVAQFGDISAKLATKFGAAGAVIDAPTRDIRFIESYGFKIFSRGIQPIDAYGKWQITDYQVPITFPGIEGDVEINPGDYFWGDRDGGFIIPKDVVQSGLEHAHSRLERENMIRKEILAYDDPEKMYNDLGRW